MDVTTIHLSLSEFDSNEIYFTLSFYINEYYSIKWTSVSDKDKLNEFSKQILMPDYTNSCEFHMKHHIISFNSTYIYFTINSPNAHATFTFLNNSAIKKIFLTIYEETKREGKTKEELKIEDDEEVENNETIDLDIKQIKIN